MNSRWQTIYTIGHGDMALDVFIEILSYIDAQTLIDIRSNPNGTDYPFWFHETNLRPVLNDMEIIYHLGGQHLGERAPMHIDRHWGLRTPDKMAYAHHMESRTFATGIKLLLNLSFRFGTVIMGSPIHPSQCHRSLIADYLTFQGHRIIHLVEGRSFIEHQPHPTLRRGSQSLIYDQQPASASNYMPLH
ncbi:MAG: DUF488 domain-containing protein [Magnetococcales bacterium]|nr:DUF488 domain-containing protein [Magnetococcales bacterium]